MNKNSLGLTKEEMLGNYNDVVPVASKELINAHEHWVRVAPYCFLCGKRVSEEDGIVFRKLKSDF